MSVVENFYIENPNPCFKEVTNFAPNFKYCQEDDDTYATENFENFQNFQGFAENNPL